MQVSSLRRQFLLGVATVGLAGCARLRESVDDGSIGTTRDIATESRWEVTPVPGESVGFTHLRRDGNRVVSGTGAFPEVSPVDVELDISPAWVVGLSISEEILWVVVGESGGVRGIRMQPEFIKQTAVSPRKLPAGFPPVVEFQKEPRVLEPRTADASRLTPPVGLSGDRWVFIENGDLVLRSPAGEGRLSVNALPDSRILQLDDDRLVLLVDATTRYAHGVLGDTLEAGGVAVVTVGEDLRVERVISPPGEAVIEGIAPILADLTEMPDLDIVVTESTPEDGARIVAYGPDGSRRATGPAIGTGNRWRHQLAVTAFGPSGEQELAVVRTPHIGGVTEFYQASNDALEIVATVDGYSSHVIGSRNLDGGLAGDFSGDGQPELVVPTASRSAIAGIHRSNQGASEAWRLSIGDRLSTNLAATRYRSNELVIGVGRADGVFRVWR